MKLFHQCNLRLALAHSERGGQALHMHSIVFDDSPGCFVRDVRKGRRIAHLFDQDLGRLMRTVRELGVQFVLVEHKGGLHQHVDLCGKPLLKALELAGVPWPGKMAKPISEVSGEEYIVPCPKQGLVRFDRDRAGGDVICETCGFRYHDHPRDFDHTFLTVLCDGSVVKL